MRTSQRLTRIAKLADMLREQRGDTIWTDPEREAVSDALDLLETVPK